MDRIRALYQLLGDEARLRLLRILGKAQLNVSELTAVLGIAQSGVSRHLGLLRDAGLVAEARQGGYVYYALSPQATTGELAPVWSLLQTQFASTPDTRETRADEARLQEVLRIRKENFDVHGTSDRQLVPGRSWAAWARALGHLLPDWTVADIGCGEGYLSVEAAKWARQVIAVDRSSDVLRRARDLARRRGVSNIVWKRGEIEKVPIATASVDLALLSQALHHAADPARAIAEAERVTRAGGRVLVLELRAHDQGWVRERLGDRWLGFGDRELAALLRDTELEDVKVDVGARLKGDPFTVLIASGRKQKRSGRRQRNSRPAGTGNHHD